MGEASLIFLAAALGVVVLGAGMWLVARFLSRRRAPLATRPWPALLRVAGRTAMLLGGLAAIMAMNVLVAILVGAGLLVIASYQRRARRHALLSALLAAAERKVPLAPLVEAFGWECRGRAALQAGRVARLLQAGWTLHDALAQAPSLVKPCEVLWIRIGHESGALPAALRAAVVRYEEDEAFWSRIGGRIVYLCCVLTAVVGISAYILWGIVPKLEKIFLDFDADLPAATQLVIRLARGLGASWWMIGLGLVVILGGVGLAMLRHRGRIKWSIPWVESALLGRHTSTILEALGLAVAHQRAMADALATLAQCEPIWRLRFGMSHRARIGAKAFRTGASSPAPTPPCSGLPSAPETWPGRWRSWLAGPGDARCTGSKWGRACFTRW